MRHPKFENPIAYTKDVLEKAVEYDDRFSKEEYADVLKTVTEFMRQDIQKGTSPAYQIPLLGTMYMKLEDAKKAFSVPKTPPKKISNHQIRYEKILKEVMELSQNFMLACKRLRIPLLERIYKKEDCDIEYVEAVQKRNHDIAKGKFYRY